jgi:hypothetical protein
MKKNQLIWLSLALSWLAAGPLAAQKTEPKRGAYLIVGGGVGACKGSLEYETQFFSYEQIGHGLSLGLGLGIPVVAKWGMFAQAELRYSQKQIGAPWHPSWGGPVGATYTLIRRNDYLELPLLLRKNFALGRYVTAYALAGPVVSLKHQYFKAYLDDYSFIPPEGTTLTPELATWARNESEYEARNSRAFPNQRVGWLVGAGILAHLGQRHQLGLELRHHQARVYPQGASGWLNLKTTSLNLVYKINLGK